MDHIKWRRMIRGNWSDRSSDSDAERWLWIIHFWCRLKQVNLDL